MGLKENMMKGMMGNMSTEEKKEMIESMMAHFFGSMSAEEKKELMASMMPKMMQQMMGGGGMMGMMAGMMGGGKSSDSDGPSPMDMCKSMMLNLKESRQTAMIATPELQGLFLDWIQQVEEEVLGIISKKKSIDVDTIAAELKLSSESISYLIARLSAAKKVKVAVAL